MCESKGFQKKEGIDMSTNTDWNRIKEDHELAYFRADVCLGSPQSFSLEEKKQICADMEASTAEVDAALRADFESLPPVAQDKMLDLLQKVDPGNFNWWKEVLLDEMPDTLCEITDSASAEVGLS